VRIIAVPCRCFAHGSAINRRLALKNCLHTRGGVPLEFRDYMAVCIHSQCDLRVTEYFHYDPGRAESPTQRSKSPTGSATQQSREPASVQNGHQGRPGESAPGLD
jgi:hypothetical protein